ncbi:MAG: zinc-ribbon domain-containing protein, partial [Promethearchaeota archaeon]
MNDDNEDITGYCVHCGAKIDPGKVYCPNCGKLVVKIKSDKAIYKNKQLLDKPKEEEKRSISRKCPGCGSIITSTVLEQCPICNTVLEPVPELQKASPTKTSFIFTKEKLEPEQKLVIQRDTWNLKEGLNVFTNSLLIYITIELFLILFI